MNTQNFQGLLVNYKGKIITADESGSIHAEDLRNMVKVWVSFLAQSHLKGQAVGLLADNCAQWLALDMACAALDVVVVPLPSFFTDEQLKHAVGEACVTTLVTDNALRGLQLGFTRLPEDVRIPLLALQRPVIESTSPVGIHKITFTSGTTGTPKGVCLDQDQQFEVAQALNTVTAGLDIKRHLCLLPFSVLLENIAGLYAPLIAGADIVCPPLAETGLTGAASFDANQCLNAIARYEAESVVLLPQMLMALLQASFPGDPRVKSLKFMAVGGGKVPQGLLTLAHMFNWPVYEGYGLSECASVVCLNTPERCKPGTVGRPLPGVEIRVDEHREILVRGRKSNPYLHELHGLSLQKAVPGHWLATGDLGSIDSEGFLSIDGRKKNLIITGFGRNISPEWPEGLLLSTGLFLQAVVFGEGQKSLCALLVLREAIHGDKILDALNQVNQQLPDYAQIADHRLVSQPFSFQNGLCTANGRVKREAIWRAYGSQFNGELA